VVLCILMALLSFVEHDHRNLSHSQFLPLSDLTAVVQPMLDESSS